MVGEIISSVAFKTLLGAAAIIIADAILGVLVSFKNGEFDIRMLPKFLARNLLPYVGGLLLLALLSPVSEEISSLFFMVAATVGVKFLAEIKDKIMAIFG